MASNLPDPEGYREPYERQPGETSKGHSVFCIYRDMGGRRSLKGACKQFYGSDYGPSKLRHCQEWSRHWNWVQRVAAWDALMDREARLGQAEAVKEMNRRHGNIAKAALGKIVQALQKLDAKDMDAQDIRSLGDWAAKLERLCLGEATEHTKQDVKTEGTMTLEVVEKIVVVGDAGTPSGVSTPPAPALPPPTGACNADGSRDADVLEITDDGGDDAPDFVLPELPPLG